MPSDVALLARSPLYIRVCGRDYVLPWRPVTDWVVAVDRLGSLAARLATPEDRERMSEDILTTPGAVEQVQQESKRILAEATGLKWFEAARLLAASLDTETMGRLMLAGLDPERMSVGQWCAATYALYLKGHNQEERTKIQFMLMLPPAGEEDAWDDGPTPDDAMAAVAALNGK